MDVHAFLAELGQRLRKARERTGKTVTQAARDAGVSRRHWTETEAGRANPSILVLARQAMAVRVRPATLLDIPWHLATTERIALVGLRGAGKSTVGRLLAQALEVPFVELDRRIEERAGLTLAQVFDIHGPDAFRRLQREALEAVLAEGDRLVLETGGSIVTSADTYRRLRETCRTVWLHAEPEEHFRRVIAQGDRRPIGDNPQAMEELRTILARRESLYGHCDLKVETTGVTPEAIVERIRAEAEHDLEGPAGGEETAP